jgi:hypothetical protein
MAYHVCGIIACVTCLECDNLIVTIIVCMTRNVTNKLRLVCDNPCMRDITCMGILPCL